MFTGCTDIPVRLHNHDLCSDKNVEDIRLCSTDIFVNRTQGCIFLTVFTEYSDDIQNRLYDFDLCLHKILISTVGFYCGGLCTCCSADIHKRLCNQDCLQDLKNLQVKLSCSKS